MAAKGYCLRSDVAAYLGRTFTTAQNTEADTLIGAAEAYIDRFTRTGWLIPPITAEPHALTSPVIYLTYRPITSVSLVTTRTTAIGDAPLTLTAGVDYEVFDPSLGQVRFASGYSGRDAYAYVSYTPALGTVPGDIALAATLIVAASMMATIFPDRLGIEKAVVDRDVQMTFVDSTTGLHVPQVAQHIIDGYRVPIFA